MNKREEIPKLIEKSTFLSDKMKKRIQSEYKTLSLKKVKQVYDFLIKSIAKYKVDDAKRIIAREEKSKNINKKMEKIHYQEAIIHAQELMELAKLEEELNNIIIN